MRILGAYCFLTARLVMRTHLIVTFLYIISVCWGFRSYIGVYGHCQGTLCCHFKGPLKDQKAGLFRNVDKYRQSVARWKTWFLSDVVLSVSKAWIDGSCVCVNMYMKLHGVGYGQTETLLFVIINVLDVFQVWGSRLLCFVCCWNWRCLSSCIACMPRVWVGRLKDTDRLGDWLGGRIILKRILAKLNGWAWTSLMSLWTGQSLRVLWTRWVLVCPVTRGEFLGVARSQHHLVVCLFVCVFKTEEHGRGEIADHTEEIHNLIWVLSAWNGLRM